MNSLCRSLTLVVFLAIPFLSFSQDEQWYLNDVNHPSGITEGFIISGIGLPDIASNPLAKDDIFMIFSDTTFYDSRNQDTSCILTNICVKGFNYIATPQSTSDFLLPFDIGSKTVKYLYATNKYDGDPPPSGINVSSPPNQSITNEIESIIPSKNLTANHDITLASDITIIIDADDPMVNNLNKLTLEYKYIIKEDSIIEATTSSPLFNPSYIFSGSACFPKIDYPVGNLKTHIKQINSKYFFINLQPNYPIMHNFTPDEITGERSKALFILRSDTTIVDTLTEFINDIHDPNQIVAKDICKGSDKFNGVQREYVNYKLSFQNVSQVPAVRARVIIEFPDYLDPNEIKILSVRISGASFNSNRVKKVIGNNNGQVMFFSLDDLNLTATQGSNDGMVEIEFCIKKKDTTIDLEDKLLSYEPFSARTILYSVTGENASWDLNYYDEVCTLSYQPIPINDNLLTINKNTNLKKIEDENLKSSTDTNVVSETHFVNMECVRKLIKCEECDPPCNGFLCYIPLPAWVIALLSGILLTAIVLYIRKRFGKN